MTTQTVTSTSSITYTFHPVYGACPECGARGKDRERTLRGGSDICEGGHRYASAKAVYPTRLTTQLCPK